MHQGSTLNCPQQKEPNGKKEPTGKYSLALKERGITVSYVHFTCLSHNFYLPSFHHSVILYLVLKISVTELSFFCLFSLPLHCILS